MHLLPNTLAPLAAVADKRESARYATTGVRVELLPDGGWRAVATDTKQLLQVTGSAACPADDFPAWDALAAAPNSAAAGLIPAGHWAATFAAAKKLTAKRRHPTGPARTAVAVKLAPTLATFGFTDLEANRTEATPLVEGKFPPVEQIWPTKRPTLTVSLDPKLLGSLLKTMSALLPDGDQRVEFDFIDDLKPVVLRASTPEMELKGLVMPCGRAKDGPPADGDGDGEAAPTDATKERLAADVARLTAERDAIRRALAEVTRERDAAVRDARECAAERDAAREELARTPTPTWPADGRPPEPPAAGVKLTRRERLALSGR